MFFIPKLHLIISVRRSHVLNLLGYYNFLKVVIYNSFSSQSLFLKANFHFFNELFFLFFNKYLDSRFSITSFLFSQQGF